MAAVATAVVDGELRQRVTVTVFVSVGLSVCVGVAVGSWLQTPQEAAAAAVTVASSGGW